MSIERPVNAMTFIAALATAMTSASLPAIATDVDKKTCTFKGKKLYGKIQIVTSFPDVKVQEVTSFPDLKVEKVNSFPDTKVQFVSSFPDVKVQYVTSFPGLR